MSRISRDEILVDEKDKELISQFMWTLNSRGYVQCTRGLLHRLIMSPKDNQVVNHINGNKLDNRRVNLELCTQSQNVLKGRIRNNNKSGHIGVYQRPSGNWGAYIHINHKKISLGTFCTKEEAIYVREQAEREYIERSDK